MKKLAVLLLSCLMLSGCAQEPHVNDAVKETGISLDTSILETIPPETTEPETVLLTIYSPNDNADGFVQSLVEVEAITEPVLVEQLVLVGVLPEGTKVNHLALSASSEDPDWNRLSVDFNEAFRDRIQSMGSAGEYAIMGSVVNTFLTAYQAKTMTITVDGQVLESGHAVYDQPLEFFEE